MELPFWVAVTVTGPCGLNGVMLVTRVEDPIATVLCWPCGSSPMVRVPVKVDLSLIIVVTIVRKVPTELDIGTMGSGGEKFSCIGIGLDVGPLDGFA